MADKKGDKMNYQDYPEENREYMQERDQFIPQAEKYANQEIRIESYPNEDLWKSAWNIVFHQRMNLLWKMHLEKTLYRDQLG